MRELASTLVICVFSLVSGHFFVDRAMCQTVELKMSHFMPPKHVQHRAVMAPWANKMEELTKGKLKITIFPGGALGRPPQQYDNAVKGITDIAFGLQGYTPGRFPLTSCLRLPFMVKSGEQGAVVLWDMYQKYLEDEYKEVKVLWLFCHGPGHIHTTRKQVKTIEDLKGLKIRSPGNIMSKTLKRMGAVPVHMPITEVYTALERKTVDGIAVPWNTMRPFRFYEQCKFHTVAGLYTVTFFVVMNKEKYEELPQDVKKVLDDNTGQVMTVWAGRAYDQEDVPARRLVEKKGGKIYQLPLGEKERWRNAVLPLRGEWVKDMEAKGLAGEEVLKYATDKLSKTQ
jgi:TRAP-type C4-dicarboxylate transport system substrate-binding protein